MTYPFKYNLPKVRCRVCREWFQKKRIDSVLCSSVCRNINRREREIERNEKIRKVNLAKIYWTSSAPSGGLNILWDAGTNVTGFICEGTSGTYGYMPGQPGIAQPMPLAASSTGDVLVTNATATFTLVIEYHKIEATVGHGNGWTGND